MKSYYVDTRLTLSNRRVEVYTLEDYLIYCTPYELSSALCDKMLQLAVL